MRFKISSSNAKKYLYSKKYCIVRTVALVSLLSYINFTCYRCGYQRCTVFFARNLHLFRSVVALYSLMQEVQDLIFGSIPEFSGRKPQAYQGNHMGLPLRGDDRKMVCGAHPTAGSLPSQAYVLDPCHIND